MPNRNSVPDYEIINFILSFCDLNENSQSIGLDDTYHRWSPCEWHCEQHQCVEKVHLISIDECLFVASELVTVGTVGGHNDSQCSAEASPTMQIQMAADLLPQGRIQLLTL